MNVRLFIHSLVLLQIILPWFSFSMPKMSKTVSNNKLFGENVAERWSKLKCKIFFQRQNDGDTYVVNQYHQ